MRKRFFIFLTLVIGVYHIINMYIGSRLWEYVARFFLGDNPLFFWIPFWFLAYAYLGGRILNSFMPKKMPHKLIEIGSYWFGATVYLFFAFLGVDLLLFVGVSLGVGILPVLDSPMIGVAVALGLVALLTYGTWNARNPKVRDYEITISKKAGERKSLKVVMVSDIHLGSLVHNGRLLTLVETINRMEPDLVLFPGDLLDEDISHFVEQNMGNSFSMLQPPLGSYGVMGNHEYIGGHSEEIACRLEAAGIRMLRDEAVLVEDAFYIVGREDRIAPEFTGRPRKTLEELVEGLDKTRPIILMDHQPFALEEAMSAGVDLQLSGHTHRGQMFPFHWITGKIYQVDWGCKKTGDYHVIVSSGYGTWGPPIRIGNHSEIVSIQIHFQ